MYRTLPLVTALFISLTATTLADTYQGTACFSPGDLRIRSDSIELDGGSYIPATGAPSIPFVQINVAVPSFLSVDAVRVKTVELKELDGKFELKPMTEARHISDPPEGNPFVKDDAVYAKDGNFPGQFIEAAGSWDLAGQDFVAVHLYPVQYNPVKGKISLAQRIEFEVQYTPEKNPVRETYNFSEKVRAHYQAALEEAAFNPRDVPAIPPYVPPARSLLDPGDYEYVIITSAVFMAQFKDLADWRTQMGMPARIVDLYWILFNYPGSTNAEKIREFVKDAHATWGAAYFLLGGDTSTIAYHVYHPGGDDVPNDTFYADFDDDWKYEVYVGRACVNTAAEIDTAVAAVRAIARVHQTRAACER